MPARALKPAVDEPLSRTGRAIVLTAIELFGSRGYHGTSIRDIATSVGIQPGAVYNHFEGKQDILFHIIDRGLTSLYNQALAAVEETEDPNEQLRAFMTQHVRFHGDNQEQTVVIDRELGALSPPNRRAAVKKRQLYEDLLTRILKAGMSAGAFVKRDARLAAYAIIGMGTEVAIWFNPAGRLTLMDIEVTYSGMALAMMHAAE